MNDLCDLLRLNKITCKANDTNIIIRGTNITTMFHEVVMNSIKNWKYPYKMTLIPKKSKCMVFNKSQ